MNKGAVIGVIIAVIIGIAIVSAVISKDSSVGDTDSKSEEVILEESIPIEEPEIIEEESEGKDLSVEFTESINLKTP
ncbi:MAG: hypothetical protein ACE5GR_07185 [Nitrosopumilus sp.]